MAELDPTFTIEAEALGAIIDELDYFQILELEQTASPVEIKAAYFKKSRGYHPDQYYGMPDSPLLSAVAKIYKRVNEAFVVLRDDRKRVKYVADVTGPNREKKLRYTEESEEELKRQREQEMGTTPQGRKNFQQGLTDMEAGRYAQASQSFRMALTYEPQNALFKQKSDESARLASGRK